MKRYYLQDGDGVNISTSAGLMLVMRDGHLALSEFDVGGVGLKFHWTRSEPYPVLRDQAGFYVEVDEATWADLAGTSTGC